MRKLTALAMKQRRQCEPAVQKINKHQLAATVMHVQGIFMRIKALSNSGEIDRLCVDGISKIRNLSDAAELQQELDTIRERQLDPLI